MIARSLARRACAMAISALAGGGVALCCWTASPHLHEASATASISRSALPGGVAELDDLADRADLAWSRRGTSVRVLAAPRAVGVTAFAQGSQMDDVESTARAAAIGALRPLSAARPDPVIRVESHPPTTMLDAGGAIGFGIAVGAFLPSVLTAVPVRRPHRRRGRAT